MRPPLDEPEYRRWLRDAEQALSAARHQAEGGFDNWACFGAEQAAQLALKALLHGLGRDAWGRDLEQLRRAAEAAGVEAGVAEQTRRLSRHYIPARYADAHAAEGATDHYGPEDARQAIDDGENVLAWVRAVWAAL